MKRTLDYPLTKLYPDWHPVRVETPDGPDSIKEIARWLETERSEHQFGVVGTGTIDSFLIYFEDPGDAMWFALKGPNLTGGRWLAFR